MVRPHVGHVLGLCSILAACATAEEQRPIALNAQGQMRTTEAANGETLSAYDNGDGTYSYELPTGFDPNAVVYERALTWAYVRQARFPSERPDRWGEQSFTYMGPSELDVYERFDLAERFDQEGRVWRVRDVNDAALEARWAEEEAIAAADARLHSDVDVQPADQDRSSNEEPDFAIGEVVYWQPTSWSEPCGGESHVWDSDDRDKLTSMVGRQRASVIIATGADTNGPWFWSCSGVQVGVHWVLTAAHCVSTIVNPGQDPPLADGRVKVCSWGNEVSGADCVAVANITLNPEFNVISPATTDFPDDSALIELSSALSSSFEDMILADVADMNDMTVHSIGYPGEQPDNSCINNNNNTPEDSLVSNCAFPYHQIGIDVTAFSGDNARWKGDGMEGQSGSPVYHCVGGTCESGEVGRVDIIWAGWNGLYERWTGSKIGPTKTFYEGIIDD